MCGLFHGGMYEAITVSTHASAPLWLLWLASPLYEVLPEDQCRAYEHRSP